MTHIDSLEDLEQNLTTDTMSLAYFSRPGCGVCTALRPKVESLLAEFPGVSSYYVDLDELPSAAGAYSIFTIPGILVFTRGKEAIREARYVSIVELRRAMSRYYELLLS